MESKKLTLSYVLLITSKQGLVVQRHKPKQKYKKNIATEFVCTPYSSQNFFFCSIPENIFALTLVMPNVMSWKYRFHVFTLHWNKDVWKRKTHENGKNFFRLLSVFKFFRFHQNLIPKRKHFHKTCVNAIRKNFYF